MLELGRWSGSLHRDVGSYAARKGVDVLVGIRGAARYLVEQPRKQAWRSTPRFFSRAAEAGDICGEIARAGDAILFKGSRGTHVERALERLLAQPS